MQGPNSYFRSIGKKNLDLVNTAKLYDGDGGNAQTKFTLDSEVGWEQVVNNPNLHVTEGVSEYEYLKTLLPKLTGEAKKSLTLYLKEWDCHLIETSS